MRTLEGHSGVTYVAGGVTTVVWKLEQSAWRIEMGAGRSATPVMARLQLLPAHSRFSTTLPKASETSDRMAMTFMLTEFFFVGGGLNRKVGNES